MGTSSGPKFELLLLLEGQIKTLGFYSGHIGREFGRNESLPPGGWFTCAETRYREGACPCESIPY